MIAPNSRRNDYTIIAERIRQAVENHQFDIGMKNQLHFTCSIGATMFPFLSIAPNALSWDRVVELADSCLYAAKRSGRNTWVGVVPTDLATIEDLIPDLANHLPNLILTGKLKMENNLSGDSMINWVDRQYPD